jgi:ethanolamine ammonia-lyase small subunit
VSSLPVEDFWSRLRALTPARIGLGRAGDGVRTRDVLTFEAAHARARDAVHVPLDVDGLSAQLRDLNLGEPTTVTSQAADRAEYLRRPDLGRRPSDLGALDQGSWDIGLVLADGLSAQATIAHGAALVRALLERFRGGYSVAPPVIATQARVAIGDHIGAWLGVDTVLVLIGERPGLTVSDSLGVYLTHRPRPGRLDSERNCVSNIHPRGGLDYADAAAIVHTLVDGARRLGASGVGLKDQSRTIGAVGTAGASLEGAAPGREE